MARIRIGLAQVNPTMGDFAGNVAAMKERLSEARNQGVDLVAFPELAVSGYPPEDLLLKPAFVERNRAALDEVTEATEGITAVIGFVDRDADLYNAAAVAHDGRIVGTYRKQRLPNYGVFDELRYFRPGAEESIYRVAGVWIGVSICEDIWSPGGPVERMALAGADVVVNLNASPYHRGKWSRRHRMLATRAADYGVVVAYVNQVGGQDELVFDGGSAIFGADGELLAEAEPFEERLLVFDIESDQAFRARLHDPRRRQLASLGGGEPAAGLRRGPAEAGARRDGGSARAVGRHRLTDSPAWPDRPELPPAAPPTHDDLEEVYDALVLGTGDYVRKNGFRHVVLGLSGGIDSSLTAVVAADALGADAVTGVALPSRYSSKGSLADAQALAEALGIGYITLSIEDVFAATLGTLADPFEDREPDVTEENLQARIRGLLLMAFSNKFDWLVLTTGNKSEMATGYSTLYGDMAGGFAVLKDVPKTLVYELARWRNAATGGEAVIPESVLSKPPSAELRPDQRDVDSLPPYAELDPVLERYVERDWSVGELVAAGFAPGLVRRVVGLVDRSEYKRRQAPPGVKITPRAFGKDRRLPITSRYRDPEPAAD